MKLYFKYKYLINSICIRIKIILLKYYFFWKIQYFLILIKFPTSLTESKFVTEKLLRLNK